MLIQFFRPASRWLLRFAAALTVFALPAHSAHALVKCVASDGRVTFQDVLCDMNSTSVALHQRFGHVKDKTERSTRDVPQRARSESAAQASSGRPEFGATGGAAGHTLR